MLNVSYLTVNDGTFFNRHRLYLYSNYLLFINLNSLIMKKTILTVASCMLMVHGLLAEKRIFKNDFFTTENVVKLELNAFCKAIMQGDIDTVKRLIDLGEDVNEKSLGMTPAIFAARYNRAEILKVLITHGADLTRKCNKGWTVGKYAKLSNAKEVLSVLKENT